MKLNLMAPINQLGYGIAGLNILKALQAHTDVSLHMIGQTQVTNQQDADAVTRGLGAAKTFDPNAPCVKIWHQNQMAEFIGHGEHIGFPVFELDTFDQLERHHLKSCDRLFVCSEWAKDVLYNQDGWTSPQVDVIPLGVDTDIFKPVEPIKRDKTIFFNCGKWEVRKGHDVLIDIFKNVLLHDENVELWMMCTNPFNSPDEEGKWTQLYNHPKIKIIPRADTQQEVYNIMRQVDCGVFPSRGEGWNLELLEMMATGKHVIATGYSAHTEFCTEDNCSIIPITEKEPAFDGKWFFGKGNWAKLDELNIFTTSLMMRDFIENRLGTVNEAGIETAKKFSWDNTANLIMKHLT